MWCEKKALDDYISSGGRTEADGIMASKASKAISGYISIGGIGRKRERSPGRNGGNLIHQQGDGQNERHNN